MGTASYVREVLPHTASIWSWNRDYDTYVEHTLELAGSGYGKRHLRFMGLYEKRTLVASFKCYDRSIDHRNVRLNASGIGAVYTPEPFRGRGYASAMLAMHLDECRKAGLDAAYLFSDIRPEFYNDIGFVTLPSRSLSLRADGLPASRVQVTALDESQWTGIQRCFEVRERARDWRFVRTPLVWQWIKLHMRQRARYETGLQTNLVVRRGRAVAAYVFGMRSAKQDLFLIDEFGFCDAAAAALIPPLLRNAAGDLRRIGGWLPPDGARELLPRGSVRRRTDAVFMAAPLTPQGRSWCDAASLPRLSDGVWPADHI